MKKQLHKILLLSGIAILYFTTSKGQTTSTFESLTLAHGSYWNGYTTPLGAVFTDGNAIFQNFYDTSFGGFWSGGWAYSNMTDSITAGFGNLYSATTAIGYSGSPNYAVGTQNSIINLTGAASGKVVSGLYITNATIAAISMRDGDTFAKKFGGVSGNDPDWFKLTVRKYFGGIMTNDRVDFYLADYRFANNAQDYIIKTWQWVDLASLGNVDSLEFILSSSDTSSFGINTPLFFCIDNFITANSPSAIAEISNHNSLLDLFPNPSNDHINIHFKKIKPDEVLVKIFDATGKSVYSEITDSTSLIIPVAQLQNGIYTLRVTGNNFSSNKSFIKQ